MKVSFLALLISLFLGLQGCGLKGDLYLETPEERAEREAAEAEAEERKAADEAAKAAEEAAEATTEEAAD